MPRRFFTSVSSAAYTYTVLRYVHDIATGEFLNVGVALLAPERKYVNALCRTTYGRLKEVFPSLDGESFRASMRHVTHEFERFQKELADELPLRQSGNGVMGFAHAVLGADDSSLQWAPMGSGLTADPGATLEQLYERFVTAHEPRPPACKTTRRASSAFALPLSILTKSSARWGMSDTTEIAGTLAGLKALDEETIAALQAQLDEEIRLNAMGSEREARLMARLAECERLRATGVEAIRRLNTEVELISIDRDTLRAQLTETQRLLEVQLAVRDKQEAEVKRLTEKANRAVEERDRQYEADGLRVLELQTLNDGLRAELAALREAVDKAPHAPDCHWVIAKVLPSMVCSCWKRDALRKPA